MNLFDLRIICAACHSIAYYTYVYIYIYIYIYIYYIYMNIKNVCIKFAPVII